MQIKYNLTGERRRALVGALSHELASPTLYLGAPTFSYSIGSYHIDRVGTLTGPDNLDLEDTLYRAGFEATERHYDEPDTYESGLGGMGMLESPEELGMIPAFEDLRMDGREELGLGCTLREDYQGENGMQASDVPEPDTLAIEMPLTGFTPEKLENLFRLVNAKAPLLKAALEVYDLPIQQIDEDGGKLVFPWFSADADSDEVKAYTMLIERLCAAAKEKQRVTAREREIENPKYTMRCLLLSLGFIGKEFSNARKILLKNLSGNAAYKAVHKDTEVRHEVSE